MTDLRHAAPAVRTVVLSGVRATCHLVYAASWLRDQVDRGVALEVFWPEERPDGYTAILPRDGVHLHPDGRQPSPPSGGERITCLAIGAPALRLWSRLRTHRLRSQVEVVVVDEGLGTYGTWRTRRAAWAREGVSEPWLSVRAGAVALGARVLTDQRWATYVPQPRGGWGVNDTVRREFRLHVQREDAAVTDTVVLLTQPWPELGVLDERAQRDHVDLIARQVAALGLQLRVRPHPREPHDRYREWGITPDAGAGAAELDPAVVHSRAVIGGPSTALLNLAAIHGVPTLRTGIPDRPDLDEAVGRAQEGLLRQFTGRAIPPSDVGSVLRGEDRLVGG